MRWLAVAGVLVGLAFLTKMLQAFLVVPGLGLGYLVAAHGSVRRRAGRLAVGLAAMVAGAAWWVSIVAVWPADSRPYIGGSQHNSILELALGYNGFGRITGDETGSVGGQGGWGETGLLRMLGSDIGGQVGWLLPTSLVLLVAALWCARRAPRTDTVRAGLIVWGGWLLVTLATFSFMQGIFHAYYTVALAPAIAAVAAIAGVTLWRRRAHYGAALAMAAATALTAVFGFFLLDRVSGYHPWLKWAVVVVGLSTALLLGAVRHLPRRIGLVVAAGAVLAGLAAPSAYSLSTVATPHSGSIPSAGPSSGAAPGGLRGALPGGTAGGSSTAAQGGASRGGLLAGSTSSEQLTALLLTNAADYDWVAAAVGSNTASGYQLATQRPVMAIGGFNGSDPSPTLAAFKRLVAAGRIHYFVAGGGGPGTGAPGGTRSFGGGMSPGGRTSTQISSWVTSTFDARTVDGVTVYDLTEAS